jgi:alpha-2-macroglobulin
VSPGSYVHPPAMVEDMYRPHLNARTATGRMGVTGPKP